MQVDNSAAPRLDSLGRIRAPHPTLGGRYIWREKADADDWMLKDAPTPCPTHGCHRIVYLPAIEKWHRVCCGMYYGDSLALKLLND